jgi:aconitate hydratase
VIAKSFARIHWQNLVNFGILPLVFADERQYDKLDDDAILKIDHPAEQLRGGKTITVEHTSGHGSFEARHQLSSRQIEILIAGGIINWSKHHSAV